MAVADSGNTFPLHPVFFGTMGGKNDVRQMILQQIHFIHIEDLSVCFGKNTGQIHSFAGFHGLLQIHRANKPVFCHRQRQGDNLFVGQFSQSPDSGGFCCSLLTADQHTADLWIY